MPATPARHRYRRRSLAAESGPALKNCQPSAKSDVGGVALQLTDLNGRRIHLVVDAIADTQHLDRTNPGAAHAENVRLEDGAGAALHVPRADLADELGDVDPGRARLDARRVGAVQASVRFSDSLHHRERFFVIFEHALGAFGRQGRAHERPQVYGRLQGSGEK